MEQCALCLPNPGEEMGRQRCGLLSWHQVLSLAFLFWAELFASWRNLSKTYIEQLDGEAEEQRKQKEKERKLWKGAFIYLFFLV